MVPLHHIISSVVVVIMEGEIQELRELVLQLKADNEQLRQGQAGPSVFRLPLRHHL